MLFLFVFLRTRLQTQPFPDDNLISSDKAKLIQAKREIASFVFYRTKYEAERNGIVKNCSIKFRFSQATIRNRSWSYLAFQNERIDCLKYYSEYPCIS